MPASVSPEYRPYGFWRFTAVTAVYLTSATSSPRSENVKASCRVAYEASEQAPEAVQHRPQAQ